MDDVFDRAERETDPRLLESTTDFMTLADPSWRGLWWRAERIGQPSAWWQHVPFAHWLVGAIRPRCLVELGTHAGVSYAAFCQAVALSGIATRCFAVDTWKGDKQAGEYGEDVYSDLSRFHDERYAAFSTLLRSTFDEALDKIPDGSVDLLHIDGLHTYDAVRADFEHWRPKLSRQGVVLFHDTNEHQGEFGVWRLWAELRAQHPSFEFLHGHGLGVLAVGEQVPAAVDALCGVTDRGALVAVRSLFARLGERWEYETRERMLQADLAQHVGAAGRQAQAATSQFEAMHAEMQRLTEAVERERAARAQFESLHDEVHQVAEASEQARLSAERARLAAEQAVAAAHERSDAESEQRTRAERERERLADALVQAEAARAAVLAERDGLAVQARAAETRLLDLQRRVVGLDEQVRGLLAAHGQAQSERDTLLASHQALARERDEWLAGYQALAGERDDVLAGHQAAARERDLVTSSTLWRATGPLRQVAHRMPQSARRVVRGSAKLAWWSLRLSLLRRLRERRHVLERPREAVPALKPAPPSVAAPAVAGSPLLGWADEATDPPTATGIAAGPAALRVVWVSGEPTTPGHTYRVLRPAAAAAAIGVQTCIIPLAELRQRLNDVERADVLILWRLAWDEAVGEAIATARRAGARLLFDVDDLMFNPAHARAGIIDAIRSSQLDEAQIGDYFARVQAVMHQADLCLASTEEIANHMREFGKPAIVLPNGFDAQTWNAARLEARRRQASDGDKIVRIGYAGGTATHQRDFGLCAEAVAAVLRACPDVRLVLFRKADGTALVNLNEFPVLSDLSDRVEWRDCVALHDMPAELARFDINLAPLEVGNPFCEAKSELKYFDAALAAVPTVASPTGPFKRAIRNNETGFLADTTAEWTDLLTRLVRDPALRRRVATRAALAVLWRFGPERRAQELGTILDLQAGGRVAAEAFAALARRRALLAAPEEASEAEASGLDVAPHDIAFASDRLGSGSVSVVIPLYNYAHTVLETLESVFAQDVADLDLVVVNDCSTDASMDVVLEWAKAHARRFNRVTVARHVDNQGLGRTRNTGFALADTEWVMVLDADNRLLPSCVSQCLAAAREAGAAFAYPLIRRFGEGEGLMGERGWDPVFLSNGNYVDAMALVSRAAWAAVGGYDAHRTGWEDFDLWCSFAERGFRGVRVPGGPLAEYRVHGTSMIRTTMRQREKVRWMMQHLQRRHPWLNQLESSMREPAEA